MINKKKRKMIKLKVNKQLDDFKIKLFEKFGDTVKIVDVSYNGARNSATFICNKGHSTVKRPDNALNQVTHCTACEVVGRRLSYNDFVEKATIVHGGEYIYLDEPKNYCGRKSKIVYLCKKHGEVKQSAHNHLHGSKCPSCVNQQSSAEKEICQFLSDNGVRNIETNRKHIEGREIDILINDKTFGVEFNGLYFHREGLLKIGGRDFNKKESDYHSNKTDVCLKNNIDLIQIFEDDWLDNKNKVLNILSYKLKLGQIDKIYAKNVVVKTINEKENVEFYTQNCFFKYNKSNQFYGAYYKDSLVAILNLESNTITNFVVKEKTLLVGGFSKLFQHHVKMLQPIEIFIKINREYSPNFEKTVFYKCGFELIDTLPSTFDYIRFKNNESDFKSLKRLGKEIVENGDENYDFVENGFDRIWNCGYYFAKIDLSKTIQYRTIDTIDVKLNDNGGRVYRDLKDERLDSQVLELVNQGKLMKDITRILQIDKKVLNRSYERLKLQRMRFAFTVEVQELIKTMYREGKQLKDITNAVNLIVKPSAGRGKISRFLNEQGLKNVDDNKLVNSSKMNNKFFVEKFDEEVLNLFKTGNNITEIAKILKIAVNRVSESMDKQNIQREKAPFRKEIVDVIKKLRADGVSLKRIETYLNENYLGFHGLAKIRQVLKG
jgi:hypothetical protein